MEEEPVMKARLPEGFNTKANNMNNMIKKAQKMQEEMTKVQDELNEKEYTTTSGGGAVSVVITGKKEIKALTIKPEVVDPEDIEMLQDLVISAVNEAIRMVEEVTSAEMEKVTGGLNIPGLF